MNQRAGLRWAWLSLALTVVPLVALWIFAPRNQNDAPLVLAALLLVSSSMHVAASGWFLTNPQSTALATLSPWRFRYVPILVIGSAVVLAATLSPANLGHLTLLFFAWQIFHFQKQNVGITILVTKAAGVSSLTRNERRALTSCAFFGAVGLVLHPGLYQLAPIFHSSVVDVLAGAAIVGSGLLGVVAVLRRPRRQRPLILIATYLSSVLFVGPIFVFHNPYAALSGMVIAHGLQYLFLVWCFVWHADSSRVRWGRVAWLTNITVAGGLLLKLFSHGHRGGLFDHVIFGLYLGITSAHFIFDAGFWRLRHPEIRSIMAENLPWLVGDLVAVPDTSSSN